MSRRRHAHRHRIQREASRPACLQAGFHRREDSAVTWLALQFGRIGIDYRHQAYAISLLLQLAVDPQVIAAKRSGAEYAYVQYRFKAHRSGVMAWERADSPPLFALHRMETFGVEREQLSDLILWLGARACDKTGARRTRFAHACRRSHKLQQIQGNILVAAGTIVGGFRLIHVLPPWRCYQ